MVLHEGVSQISTYLGGVAGTVPEAGPAPETEKAETGDRSAASEKDAAGSEAAPEDAGAKAVQEEMQPEQGGESLTPPDKSAAGESAQSEQATPEPAAAKESEAAKTEASAQAAGTQEAPKADAPAKGAIPVLRPSPDTKAPGAGPQEAPNNSQNQTELKQVPPSASLSRADTAQGQSRSEAGVNLSSNQKDSCRVDTRNCN